MTRGILVIAEIRAGAVRSETLAALTFARRIRPHDEQPITVLLVEPSPDAIPALEVEGVGRIVHVAAEPSNDAVASATMVLVADLQPRLLIAGQTVTSVGYAARIAIDLEAAYCSGVIDVRIDDGAITATRDLYGGRLVGDVTLAPDRLAILLVRESAARAPSGPASTRPSIQRLELPPSARIRSRRISVDGPAPGHIDLDDARVVIGVGRGLGGPEDVAACMILAERLGAVVAASRPIVDAGWLPRDRLVGQSGARISPALYLAFGISGAREHMTGVQGAATIVAVNTDPRAPIFAEATHGAVADARTIIDVLLDLQE